MEDVIRGFMNRLETATDDTRTALATHGLPDVLNATQPGYRPELPETAKVVLADEFVRRGFAGQLPSMLDTLAALRDQVRYDRYKIVSSNSSNSNHLITRGQDSEVSSVQL
jgi:hypothetical protein